MKWLKAFIIIIIVLIIVILGLLIIKMNNNDDDIPEGLGLRIGLELKPEIVNQDTYFSVDACAKKFFKYIKEDNVKAAYRLLNKEYIKNKQITTENLLETTNLTEIRKYRTTDMYGIIGNNYFIYYIKGLTNKGNVYLNINFDTQTASFDLQILSENEYNTCLDTTITTKDITIERNEYNSIAYKYISAEKIVEEYFLDYINIAINFPEIAYNMLDKEYRDSRFKNIYDFALYVRDNEELNELYKYNLKDISEFSSKGEYFEYITWADKVGLEKYSKEEKDGYIEYICIDTFGNYYIFKTTSMMKYTVILDTYTLDLDEFVDKYNNSTAQEKVVLNLNKINLALDAKDYSYIYSKLADGFKAKSFPTLESFEAYAKSTFFSKNEFSFKEFSNEAEDYYMYSIKITDASKASAKELYKTFIMKLRKWNRF